MNDNFFKMATVIFSSIIFMTGCKHKYYYVEDNKEEKVIKASSDSAAYMEAPTDAMVEFSFAEPPHPNWFATMRTIKDGEIIEEEIFDASVYVINEFGDLVG